MPESLETRKLYWDDPFALTFEAERLTVATFGGKPSLVLDRTSFYPEAGGQLGDRGVLHVGELSLTIVDTQIDELGVIHHLVEESESTAASLRTLSATVGAAGQPAAVRGALDEERRATQRLQHSAQHMLSRALVDEAAAATVSARLGKTATTIDLQKEQLTEAEVARVEDLVNAVIRDDRPVTAFFPSPAELATLPLRRTPKVAERIRVIAIGDRDRHDWFDVTPCGGTHVHRTGQIGAVRITALERYKGMTRLTFLAGGRAIEDARAKDLTLGSVARDLSCGPLDVPRALAKMRAEMKTERELTQALRLELATFEGDRVLATSPPIVGARFTPVVIIKDDADVTSLRALVNRLTERADVVAIAVSRASDGNGASVIVQRGTGASLDCGAWLKAVFAAASNEENGVRGRGGGSPTRAEGRLSGPVSREFLENALSLAEA